MADENTTSPAGFHELSLEAQGLWGVLCDLGPETAGHARLIDLATRTGSGIDSIRGALAKLERAGYITRHRGRDGRGRPVPGVVMHATPVTVKIVPAGDAE